MHIFTVLELHSGLTLMALSRKKLLFSFAAFGTISTIFFLILLSGSSKWVTSALLPVLANLSFGASLVAMNSYLPSLAKNPHKIEKPIESSSQTYRNNMVKVTIASRLNSSAKAYKLL